MISVSYTSISAQESHSNSGVTNENEPERDEINWDKVISLTVMVDDGSRDIDNVIDEALLRGVPVTFELQRMPRFTYFKTVTWIHYAEGSALSVNPKDPFTIAKEASWNELYTYFRYVPTWTQKRNASKYSSTYNQYVCHADFAKGLKTPWNLEIYKPDKGYWGVVGSACD